MNLAVNLERAAFFFPDRPAISEDGKEMTYARLNERANRVATALLKMGVKQGDFIGLYAPNSADWITFYFGVLKAGAVAVTLSSVLTGDELSLLLNHSKPRFVFAYDEKLNDLLPFKDSFGLEKVICPEGDIDLSRMIELGSGSFRSVARNRADTAAILYTGGTTGTPIGVMLNHESIIVSSHNIAFYERSNQSDRGLCFLPFNHVFGQIHIMTSTIYSCGCLELLPAFDMERVLRVTRSGLVTKFFAVPTIYARLLTLDGLRERLGNIRYSFSAASSMPREIVEQWKERTGLSIHESYGLTETATAVTYNHYYRHVVGSVGDPVYAVEVQIRDASGNELEQGREGEICIRGRNVMKGYLENPEDTRTAFWDDGWFRSGDVGLFDEDGYLYIVDRIKEMIITGGENVYPREVEEVIYRRPEVELCAVVGFPDREWGERVTAFIVPKPGQKIVPEEMKSFLKAHLSPFKVPKEYIAVTDLPKSPTGKILKREVRKQFLGGSLQGVR
jgi:long-chain acyl-CoA synthetase